MNPISRLLILGGVDPDAQAWRSAVLANGGSVSGRTIKAVSGFVRQAKGMGLWSKLLRVNLICGDQLAAARTPLVIGAGSSTETVTSIVAGDYVETGSAGGIKGDGSAKSANTGWNPSTSGASSSSIGMWAYVKGTEAAGASHHIIGTQVTTTSFMLLGWGLTGTTEIGGLGTASTAEFVQGSATSVEGFLGVATNGSRSQQYYKNGAAIGSPVTATGALPNQTITILADNADGNPSLWSTRYIRGYAITSGMSAADAANLNTAMQTFQTALNRNV